VRAHDTSEFEHPSIVERELLAERAPQPFQHLRTLRLHQTHSASLTTNEILRTASASFAQAELDP